MASIVLENGESEEEVIAALLHDAAEDQGGKPTLEVIEQKFGQKVSDIVSGCTDSFDENKEQWKTRKEKYLIKLSKVTNPSVHLVSIADKLHNARCILSDYRLVGDELWDRFNAERECVLCYYNELIKIYKKFADKRYSHLVNELERTIRELEDIMVKNSNYNRLKECDMKNGFGSNSCL